MNDVKVTITDEVAELEFQRFIDSMGILLDVESMNQEDKESFANQKRPVVAAIKKGSLIINDSGEPEYTPQRSKDIGVIKFPEPSGAALKSMDRTKRSEDVAKMFVAMGETTGVNPSTFSRMAISDLKVCMGVFNFFLG